ncbi:hypothetical protein Leryth_022187 [Lithospermum erythrorhizon]|nr:hypothetical protein Leryth_022187 [Lithospermum erythrorhizon]
MNKILLNFYSSSSRSRSFLQLIFFEASRCLFISGQIKCVPLASQSLTSKISANVHLGRPISTYGHGIAFFLAPTPFQMPSNANGAFMGLFNTTLSGSSTSQILSVEFDTHSDGWDPPYQHVGINNNSYSSSVWALDARFIAGEPVDNIGLPMIIKYKESQCFLELWNLNSIFRTDRPEGGSSTMGNRGIFSSNRFTSGTGELSNLGSHSTLDINGVLSIIGGGSIALAIISKRRQNKNKTSETDHLTLMNDDLERGTGPRKFCYKDLATATSNFSVERKLGQGGFGGVYKGYRVDQDIPIAVKKFSSGSKQGKKEYITKITLGGLRDTNNFWVWHLPSLYLHEGENNV